MEIKFKKLDAGLYEMFLNGERAGVIGKSVNGDWTGTDCSTGAGTAFHVTRKLAAEALIQERAEILAEIAAAKEIVDQERAQEESYEEICKSEIAARVAEKIQPMPKGTQKEKGMIWIGDHLYKLNGSDLMDFDEFMFLYSYGYAYNEKTQEKLAEEYAEGHKDEIEGHFQNFIDTWADYQRDWKKENPEIKEMDSAPAHNPGILEEVQEKIQKESWLKLDLQAFASAEPEVIHSIDRAIWEIKEAGEARISLVILEPVMNFLLEMDITFIKSRVDDMTWDIIQGDPEDSSLNDLGIAGIERP